MTVTAWRIVHARHREDAFSGEGARLYGGRWNSKGTPLIYTSGSISLAALELLVNLPSPKLLEGFVRIPLSFPPDFIKIISLAELPKDWRDHPISPTTREMGDQWVRENSSVVLRVPSVVIPEEFNYLLNPTHPDFSKIQIGEALVYRFDPRLTGVRSYHRSHGAAGRVMPPGQRLFNGGGFGVFGPMVAGLLSQSSKRHQG